MEASKTFVDSKARQYMVLQTEMVRLKREEKALIQFYEKLTAQSSALKLEAIRLKALLKKATQSPQE
ncbi:unnamed protein product [Enterobius vermicularis]|uniref:Transposase n=1 Tax=Enterobius vermicularis TaxID=51028 RepID=A0A0N4VKL4_ENTVE|nr:unnamed protein product [Enterobius vermicularis]